MKQLEDAGATNASGCEWVRAQSRAHQGCIYTSLAVGQNSLATQRVKPTSYIGENQNHKTT